MSTTYRARTLVLSIVDVENTQGLVCLSATDGETRTTYMVHPNGLTDNMLAVVGPWSDWWAKELKSERIEE